MSSTRQLAAIMFTDIVGYTALMGEDEVKAFDILRKNRLLQKPLIEQYNGKWIKELGDGVLASFPTVTEAVLCATEIQNICNKDCDFKLRIGIHQGEVVFEDNDVFGDGVNIASRIQAIAPIGGIWVSEPVYYNIINKKNINAKFIRSENLKHVQEPVRIYEITTGPSIPKTKLLNTEPNKKPYKNSLAVLPFTDMSPAKDQEYLGDGIAEELLTLMAQVKELKVIGRTSCFSFKNKDVDLKTIGKLLEAGSILEGSIQKVNNRIRITAQLIDATDASHIWSQRYDREMDDIFALQDDICSKIAEHLKITLLEEYETREENKPTNNSKAYEWFLKADYYCKRYGWENFERAIDCCKKAIELDQDYADAWWLLGYCYFEKHNWLYLQKENIETAVYCTNKAISIDKTNADAHFMLALINFNYYYDWDKTMSEIALANQYTRTTYPLFFLPAEAWTRGMLFSDFDFARRHMQKGIDHDPLNFIYQFHLAQLYLYLLHDYANARNILNNITDLGFPAYACWRPIFLSYLFEGQYELAEEYARKDYEASGGRGHGAANLIISLVATGKKKEAEELYQSVNQSLPIQEFPEFLHVKVNAWLGRIDDAFEYLDKAITERSIWLFTLKVSPEWDPLRSDPRFQKVLERMKFPK